MKKTLIAIVVLLFVNVHVSGQEKPSIPNVDRVRMAEAFKLNDVVGNHVWPGWEKVPFAVMLITPDYEFLIRHPQPSDDFALIGYDSLLKSNVYFRKRKLPTRLLATAPFIQGSNVAVIAVGQAENTESKTSTEWVITLFHEHFHQLQYSQDSYYADVNALNLAHGDQTGSWMLNFAFPYDNKDVQEQFSTLAGLLSAAVNANGKVDRESKTTAYLQARQRFQQTLNPEDYKYLSFELWQEGIARYTEFRIAEFAAAHYKPSAEFTALKDFTPFGKLARATRARIMKQLVTEHLGESKREVVYPFGAAEALLLDSVRPVWRRKYFTEKFDLGKYY